MPTSHRPTAFTRRHSAGLTLIEVMLTVFVFSVGLIGIAGLQTLSKRSNYEAVQRTTASLLAQDIAERMRANPTQLDAYRIAALKPGQIGTEPTPNCIGANTCSPAQLAAHDLWEWQQAIAGTTELSAANASVGGLVLPTGCITGPAGGGPGNYTITLVWRSLTALTDQGATACGDGDANYGASEEFRRFVAISTFIGS